MDLFRKTLSTILIVISIILLTGITAANPPETECTDNPGHPACEKPFYTDNQAEYFYDLRASWIFNNGIPDNIGPTVFHGGAAGNLEDGFENDTVTDDTKTEYYIEDPGEAEGGIQENFGRGPLQNTAITITNSKTGSDNLGDFLINPPHEGQCGDGIPNTGNKQNCPEDHGLPNVEIDGFTPGTEIMYNDIYDEEIFYESGITPQNEHVEGDYNSGLDNTTDGNYIEQTELENNTNSLTETHYYYQEVPITTRRQEGDGDDGEDYYKGGEDAENLRESVCIEISPIDAFSQGDAFEFERTHTIEEFTGEHYENGAIQDRDDSKINVSYNEDWNVVDPDKRYYQCDEAKDLYEDCSDPVDGDCDEFEPDTYAVPDTAQPLDYVIYETGFEVSWDRFELDSENVWGPVNNKPGIADDDIFSGVSGNIDNSHPSGYHAYGDQNTGDSSNDPSVSFNHFELVESGGDFVAERQYADVSNADGSDGQADGLIAYDEVQQEIVGSTEGFLQGSLWNQDVENDMVTENDVINALEDEGGCPGDTVRCVAAVDISTKTSGWTSSTNSFEINFADTNPVSPRESAGAAELYNSLVPEEDRLHISPGPNYDVCGAYPWDQHVVKQGQEVNDTVIEEYQAHQEACAQNDPDNDYTNIDHQEGYCVLGTSEDGTELVEEGTVANIAPIHHDTEYHEDDYQEGGNSPDRQVCLDIQPSFEGEWYSLDDERINTYLIDNEDSLNLNTDQRVGNPDHIDYYYTEHPNPQHDTYNPEGEQKGVALLADCGPLMTGCGNPQNQIINGTNNQQTFFTFFQDKHQDNPVRITDYHPLGLDEESYVDPFFKGYVNKIRKAETEDAPVEYHQLDEEHPDNNGIDWWYDTEADENSAVQFAYTRYRNWTVDSTGEPYPPFGASETGYDDIEEAKGSYMRRNYIDDRRENLDDPTIDKTKKAFGNSLAVTATTDISEDIREGEGFWINPDNVKYHWDEGHINGTGGTDPDDDEGWRDLITFELDLTGPDVGIGYDIQQHGDYEEGDISEKRDTTGDGEYDTVFADIHWEENSPMAEGLEPPVCGDDQAEYLVEELGETINSEKGQGRYACVTEIDEDGMCVSFEGEDDQTLYSIGEYHQTNEEGEQHSRVNRDFEVCAKRDQDPQPTWYDQDYAQEINGQQLCRENTLYGEHGKRWIDQDYIQQHPEAVTGGIDDSWNPRLEQQNHEYLISDPEAGELNETHTPVPTGNQFNKVANPTTGDYGFCAGDDEGEQLVVQRSNTHLVDTDNEVIGAATARQRNSCILDHSEYDVDVPEDKEDKRVIYHTGENVEFNTGQEIACFDGMWYGDWPVSIHGDGEMEVVWNQTKTATFQLINIHDQERTFNVEIEEPDTTQTPIARVTNFVESDSQELTTTVPPKSSTSHSFETLGLDPQINGGERGEIRIIATATDHSIQGEDSMYVDVVEGDLESVYQDTRPVAGIQLPHLIVLFVIALLVYYWNNRNQVSKKKRDFDSEW